MLDVSTFITRQRSGLLPDGQIQAGYYSGVTTWRFKPGAPGGSQWQPTLSRRAVEMLNEVRIAGLFNDSNVTTAFESDGDLNPLRARDDFKRLMAQVVDGEAR